MANEDIAQEVELREWEHNNRSRGSKKVRFAPDEKGYGPEFCEYNHCGEEMPQERRAWGFRNCFGCQTRIEQRAKHLA